MSGGSFDILLAHHHPVSRSFIKTKLLENGFARVVAVDGGRQALSRLQRVPFDAIVTALLLPDIDCWRLAQMIRSGRFCASSLSIIAIVDQAAGQSLTVLATEHNVAIVEASEIESLQNVLANRVHNKTLPTLLIIEDDKEAARAVQLALDKVFDLEVQHDGEQGLQAWKARKHDIVLLDVMLPKISGAKVLEEIMKLNPRQPVVIITAYATADRHRELIIAGAIDFIEKPFNVNAMHRVCETALLRSGLMVSVTEAEQSSLIMDELASRVRVADENLSVGRTEAASFHLKNAVAASRRTELSEDQWSHLIGEFPDC